MQILLYIFFMHYAYKCKEFWSETILENGSISERSSKF